MKEPESLTEAELQWMERRLELTRWPAAAAEIRKLRSRVGALEEALRPLFEPLNPGIDPENRIEVLIRWLKEITQNGKAANGWHRTLEQLRDALLPLLAPSEAPDPPAPEADDQRPKLHEFIYHALRFALDLKQKDAYLLGRKIQQWAKRCGEVELYGRLSALLRDHRDPLEILRDSVPPAPEAQPEGPIPLPVRVERDWGDIRGSSFFVDANGKGLTVDRIAAALNAQQAQPEGPSEIKQPVRVVDSIGGSHIVDADGSFVTLSKLCAALNAQRPSSGPTIDWRAKAIARKREIRRLNKAIERWKRVSELHAERKAKRYFQEQAAAPSPAKREGAEGDTTGWNAMVDRCFDKAELVGTTSPAKSEGAEWTVENHVDGLLPSADTTLRKDLADWLENPQQNTATMLLRRAHAALSAPPSMLGDAGLERDLERLLDRFEREASTRDEKLKDLADFVRAHEECVRGALSAPMAEPEYALPCGTCGHRNGIHGSRPDIPWTECGWIGCTCQRFTPMGSGAPMPAPAPVAELPSFGGLWPEFWEHAANWYNAKEPKTAAGNALADYVHSRVREFIEGRRS